MLCLLALVSVRCQPLIGEYEVQSDINNGGEIFSVLLDNEQEEASADNSGSRMERLLRANKRSMYARVERR